MLVTMVVITVGALVRRFGSRGRPGRPRADSAANPERGRPRWPSGFVVPAGLGLCGAGAVTAALVLC
ncbi:hypothetical protein [Nocardia sp. NPDC024068]|uniref:hypothetical protein n=1 Tax=Nocardia sp. NPDC024068 TaxID=3157197 RepID=UPI0033E7C0FB